MKFTKPKLIPTLICLAVVGLLAAVVPYPGFSNHLDVIQTDASD